MKNVTLLVFHDKHNFGQLAVLPYFFCTQATIVFRTSYFINCKVFSRLSDWLEKEQFIEKYDNLKIILNSTKH